jgi:hypothetical protein
VERNEWVLDYHAKLGRTLSKYAEEKLGRKIHLSYGYGLMSKAMQAYDLMWAHGALGPAGETFNGGLGGRGEVDLEAAANWHYEHECYLTISIEDHPMEFGPISAIDEALKEHILRHKHMPKFIPSVKCLYNTPYTYVDAAIAAFKKYGRYE